MTDRLANIVTGLQRLGEETRTEGDDIRSSQGWEDEQHARKITQLLNMVEKVRRVLLEERARFMPVGPEEVNEVGQLQNRGNAATAKSLQDQREAMRRQGITPIPSV